MLQNALAHPDSIVWIINMMQSSGLLWRDQTCPACVQHELESNEIADIIVAVSVHFLLD